MASNWSQTRNQIIERALRIIGVLSFGNNPRQEWYNIGATVFNAVLEDLSNDGVRIFKLIRSTESITQSTITYTLGETVMDIFDAYLTDSSDDDKPPLSIINAYDYNAIPDKDSEGEPLQLYIEYLQDSSKEPALKLYLYPAPDASYTLNYLAVTKPSSIDSASATPDLMKNWWNAVTYKIAEHLADEFRKPMSERQWLNAKAESLIKKARKMDFRNSPGSYIPGAYPSINRR